MSNHGLIRFIFNLQANCAISFLFYLYLILHIGAAIFDVIFLKIWILNLNKALTCQKYQPFPEVMGTCFTGLDDYNIVDGVSYGAEVRAHLPTVLCYISK